MCLNILLLFFVAGKLNVFEKLPNLLSKSLPSDTVKFNDKGKF